MNREDSDGYVHAYYVPSIKDPGVLICMCACKNCNFRNIFPTIGPRALIFQRVHVVGTQKNRLDETVLSSTRNLCLN